VVDALVVRQTGARRPYLQALWSIASPPQAASVAGLRFLNRGHLRARVAQLTQEVSMSRRRAVFVTTAFAALLAATAAFATLTFPLGQSPAAAAFAAAGSPKAQIADPGGPPYRVGGDVTRPAKISGDKPVYPASAKADHAQGVVILETIITEAGRLDKTKILKSSGRPDLDQAALDGVAGWVFEPATLDGKPVKVIYEIMVNFQPDEDKKEGASR
jgi:TonB family protein